MRADGRPSGSTVANAIAVALRTRGVASSIQLLTSGKGLSGSGSGRDGAAMRAYCRRSGIRWPGRVHTPGADSSDGARQVLKLVVRADARGGKMRGSRGEGTGRVGSDEDYSVLISGGHSRGDQEGPGSRGANAVREDPEGRAWRRGGGPRGKVGRADGRHHQCAGVPAPDRRAR